MPPKLSASHRPPAAAGLTVLIFGAVSALYFLGRTPALDEWDSVQFAQGVGDFNLWRHHPHPPGYPLYILAGWLGRHGLGLAVPTALQLASALGGGLFVAAWFALGARAFGRWVGGWGAAALGTLLITVMTATKVLTDAPAAGVLALTLLLASERRFLLAALAAAGTVGLRPQTFPVLALIVGGMTVGLPGRRKAAAWAAFLGGCLLWLLPTMLLQAQTPESGGDFLAYPAQLVAQWRWRLDQPKAFVGAATQGQSFWRYRLDHHGLGLLTRGGGWSLSSGWGWLGIGVWVVGWGCYLWTRRRGRTAGPPPAAFWRTHLPWAALYVVIVFCCLPGDQRYYLPVFPLLLFPAVAGWARTWPGAGGRWLAGLVPAATLLATLPLAVENHREAAPPVRMLRFLQAAFSPGERSSVHLVLHDSFRHAQWYAPDFDLVNTAQDAGWTPPDEPAGTWYTDDPALVERAPGRWQVVARFARPILIYRKHHEVTLYRLAK